ncbi:uncharacterized protein LOC131057971 [Cryptomeria japonica]|uniref:uncharacterized protein LOC131057971 n=1 Tax=Cryptomeria japonica TaxID=3369 RepID=UPI0027DAA1DA|nr:uncharacterized protein LOC131057971 [Cryptomeria japonica]
MEECNSEACLTQITQCPNFSPPQNGHNNIKKRQLPQWMLGVTGVEAASKTETITGNRAKKSQLSADENGSSNGRIQEERRPKRAADRPPKRAGSSSTKRTAKRGVGIESGGNSAAEDDAKRVSKERKQIGSRKGAPRVRRKMKDPQFESDIQEDHISDIEDDIEDPSEGISIENGLDLSVEDLLSMAKQRVDAEEKEEAENHGTRTNMKAELQEQEKPPRKAASVFSNDEWKDLSYSTRCSEVASSTTENNTRGISDSNLTEKESLTLMMQCQKNTFSSPPGKPDDIAQNMLDLLLGPSLMCSQNEDKKPKLLLEELNSVTNVTEADHRTEEAPIFKKKSSLRDKVTMLLS